MDWLGGVSYWGIVIHYNNVIVAIKRNVHSNYKQTLYCAINHLHGGLK